MTNFIRSSVKVLEHNTVSDVITLNITSVIVLGEWSKVSHYYFLY